MDLDLQRLFRLHVHSCTNWLRPRNPPPRPPAPPRIRAIRACIRGRYWSAKIDDISLWPSDKHVVKLLPPPPPPYPSWVMTTLAWVSFLLISPCRVLSQVLLSLAVTTAATHSWLVKLSLLPQLLFHHKLYAFCTQNCYHTWQPPTPPPPPGREIKWNEHYKFFKRCKCSPIFAYTSSDRFFFRHIFSIYFPDLESSGNILDSGTLESFLSRMLLYILRRTFLFQ
jgi:hypothetical protein